MKKNKMMRLASGLLVAVLITTSTISGTFAKYVTADIAEDSARVAKWGVVVTADGTLFGKTYLNATGDTPGADDADPATITVKSSNDEKVVAPGTKNDTGISASISGKPEVDVRVMVAVRGLLPDGSTTDEVKDIYLASETYADLTTGNTTDSFTAPDTYGTGFYYPVVFTLTHSAGAGVTAGTLAEVEEYLEDLSTTYEANTNLANEIGDLKLTWTWDYGTKANDAYTLNVSASDEADTYLGFLAASDAGEATFPTYDGTTPVVEPANVDYNLETGLELTIVVEQIN